MEIYLSQGKYAIVDDSDYEWLMSYKWTILRTRKKKIYAQTRFEQNGKYTGALMHRLVMGIEKGDVRQVDHINHNTLDNRRENLRVVTNSQNKANRRSFRGSSKFKGVVLDISCNKWKASIGVNRKHINLGRFDNEIEAAVTYDKAAIKYFGDYALTNFPKENYVDENKEQ